MAPLFCIDLRANERRTLLQIARQSISNGLRRGSPVNVEQHADAGILGRPLGVFVTLTRDNSLRGCIGSMETQEPLAKSVAESAFGAAFRDPRFPQLQVHELQETHIGISILSPMEPLAVTSRGELLSGLRPHTDGLLLQDREHRSTFLPQVWQQLPDPETFLDQLLLKAGLPAEHWSSTLEFFRYHTVSFGEPDQPDPP